MQVYEVRSSHGTKVVGQDGILYLRLSAHESENEPVRSYQWRYDYVWDERGYFSSSKEVGCPPLFPPEKKPDSSLIRNDKLYLTRDGSLIVRHLGTKKEETYLSPVIVDSQHELLIEDVSEDGHVSLIWGDMEEETFKRYFFDGQGFRRLDVNLPPHAIFLKFGTDEVLFSGTEFYHLNNNTLFWKDQITSLSERFYKLYLVRENKNVKIIARNSEGVVFYRLSLGNEGSNYTMMLDVSRKTPIIDNSLNIREINNEHGYEGIPTVFLNDTYDDISGPHVGVFDQYVVSPLVDILKILPDPRGSYGLHVFEDRAKSDGWTLKKYNACRDVLLLSDKYDLPTLRRKLCQAYYP